MKKSPVRARPTTNSAVKPASEIIAEALSRVTQKSKSKSTAKSSPTVAPGSPKAAKAPARPAAKSELPPESVAKDTAPRKSVTARGGAPRKSAAVPAKSVDSNDTKSVGVKSADIKSADIKSASTKAETKTLESKKAAPSSAALRATKKRAPKDLAIQYGEKEKAPRAGVPKAAPRKRRSANMRARLQQVIAPDEGVLLRLAQAGAISSSHAPEGAADKPLRPTKTRRSRKWETFCGKCGASAQYSTSAALCVRCGAILVRD